MVCRPFTSERDDSGKEGGSASLRFGQVGGALWSFSTLVTLWSNMRMQMPACMSTQATLPLLVSRYATYRWWQQRVKQHSKDVRKKTAGKIF